MVNARAMKFSAILAGLFLAGCITTNYAVYKHPVTGDVLECEEAVSTGGVLMIAEKSYYADCKNLLEKRGYERTGTVKRAPIATSASEIASPKPAPR